ncbi:MAG: tetratricopeptide repeat protein, partial [Alphaproteobacteria bacterium]|nr:tetratricopeptide repeat protein [Alphaproteobacteria bacterium]
TLAAAGQHAGAVADFDVAIARDGGLVSARYNRGGAFLALGRYDAAVEDYNAVLALAPGYAAAHTTVDLRSPPPAGATRRWPTSTPRSASSRATPIRWSTARTYTSRPAISSAPRAI